MGDAVDNIPGIPGVGEKTAAKLLKEFGTVENVVANASNIKGALGEKVRKGADSAIMSKKLAKIITNVPVEFHEENFRLKEWNKADMAEIFAELEFKTIGKRILGEDFNVFQQAPVAVQTDLFAPEATPAPAPANTQKDLFGNDVVTKEAPKAEAAAGEELAALSAQYNINNVPHNYILVDTEEKIAEMLANLAGHTEICYDSETTGLDANDAEMVGMSFAVKPYEAWYVPVPADQEAAKKLLQHFVPLFDNEAITWVGQNIKYDMLVLKWYGIELKGNIYDTMLVHYVIEPDGRRSMDLLSAQYLSYEPVHIEELIGKKGKAQGTMRDVAVEKIKDYAAEDADITLQLKYALHPGLASKEVERVFYEVENPLVKVLTDMEFEGVRIDMEFLKTYSKELEKEAHNAEQNVYAGAGVRFNLASPKQLGEVLFDKLKLDPKAKKTKTGQYATGEDVLLKLSHTSPIVEDILIFRELTKLKSTYVDALPLMINRKTGRVHTSYAQAVAVTGRLSSNNPNLQNIPIRTDRGKEIVYTAG
jgi:DNA polymerase-1